MEKHEPLRGPARIWSIVAMSLLCVVLTTVLLHRPTPPAHDGPRVEQPAPQEPPLTQEERHAVYRVWPLFEGWPLLPFPEEGLEPEAPAPHEGAPPPAAPSTSRPETPPPPAPADTP